ncbi:MAG: ankyrin repeat domain-containing protein [Desulfobacteraceae bacterium]|nr:ankyrin repeat domain-containing protein [Desulfobacteraceae bacterium]
MAIDPKLYPPQYSKSNNDTGSNQNNQPTERLQSLDNDQSPKAKARNNTDGSNPSASSFKKLQTFRINAHSQDDKNKHLFDAIYKGDAESVKSCLDAGADVNTIDKSGSTPLYEAAKRGQVEVVKALLSHPNSCDEIDLNQPNINGYTPNYWANYFQFNDVQKELVSHPDIKFDDFAMQFLDERIFDNDVKSLAYVLSKEKCSENVKNYVSDRASWYKKLDILNLFPAVNGEKLDCLVTGYSREAIEALVPDSINNLIKPFIKKDLA